MHLSFLPPSSKDLRCNSYQSQNKGIAVYSVFILNLDLTWTMQHNLITYPVTGMVPKSLLESRTIPPRSEKVPEGGILQPEAQEIAQLLLKKDTLHWSHH